MLTNKAEDLTDEAPASWPTDEIGRYVVPVDPMDALRCDSCE